MSNPYTSPQFASSVTPDPEQRANLRRIAKYQQWVLYALLASILSYMIFFAGALARHELIAQLALLVFVLSSLFGVVAVFLLANEMHGIIIGLLCGVLMFFPCISLITLLIVNSKATAQLKAHGVKVGLMGANPGMI